MTVITDAQLDGLLADINTESEVVESAQPTTISKLGTTIRTLSGTNATADVVIADIGNRGDNAINDIITEGDATIVDIQTRGDAALGALGGVALVSDYTTDPTFTIDNEYVNFDNVGVNERWKLVDSVVLPYAVDSTTYPDPEDDPSLIMFNDVTQEYVNSNFDKQGTLSSFVNDPDLQVDGGRVIATDRGSGIFDKVLASSVDPVVMALSMNIIQCAGNPLIALVLIVEDRAFVEQLGAPTDGTGNPTPYIEHAFTLRNTVDLGGSENFFDITEVIGLPSNGIYSTITYRLTGSGATVHPSVPGEAIFTSVTAKADPESTANLFTSKWLFDGFNTLPKVFTPDALPTYDGRVFNGDRLYNTVVYSINATYIERFVDSRRKKSTEAFHEEGYLQSFHVDHCQFAYCSYLVQYSYGYNFSFTGNKAEACEWGIHSIFDAGSLLTPRIMNNLFEGIGVFLKIPSAKGGILHGVHLEMGASPAASYLASKALIDFSPAGPISAQSLSRQWDIRGVFGSVPLIYDGDDFEFSLISTTNATYPNVKSPDITFSSLSYRAEHLIFSQGSEVGSPTEASPNLLKNANFQINQNGTVPTTDIVTGKEIDLWDMRSLASASPITTYQAGFDRGGAYGGSHSFTLAGATKSHFITQRIPMGRDIINGIGGYGGGRAFVTVNMDLPSQTLVRVQLAYSRDSDGVDFGSANQFILIEGGLRNNHFALDMPDTTRLDDADYSLVCQITFNGPAGDGTAAPSGNYKIYFAKVEFNSIFATPFTANDFESDLHAARKVYYRAYGDIEIISCRQAANSIITTTKTLPLTSMSAATYTVEYQSIDLYLGGVLTNTISGPGITFDGHSIRVSHNGGGTFNGYEQINGLTITAD